MTKKIIKDLEYLILKVLAIIISTIGISWYKEKLAWLHKFLVELFIKTEKNGYFVRKIKFLTSSKWRRQNRMHPIFLDEKCLLQSKNLCLCLLGFMLVLVIFWKIKKHLVFPCMQILFSNNARTKKDF